MVIIRMEWSEEAPVTSDGLLVTGEDMGAAKRRFSSQKVNWLKPLADRREQSHGFRASYRPWSRRWGGRTGAISGCGVPTFRSFALRLVGRRSGFLI